MSVAKSVLMQINTKQNIHDKAVNYQRKGIDNFNAWVFGSPIIEVLLIHHLVEVKHGQEWKVATVINYSVQLDKHFILYDNGIYDLVDLQRDCADSKWRLRDYRERPVKRCNTWDDSQLVKISGEKIAPSNLISAIQTSGGILEAGTDIWWETALDYLGLDYQTDRSEFVAAFHIYFDKDQFVIPPNQDELSLYEFDLPVNFTKQTEETTETLVGIGNAVFITRWQTYFLQTYQNIQKLHTSTCLSEDKYTELGVLVFHPTKREQAVALANARKDCDKLWNLIFGCNDDIINEKKNILSVKVEDEVIMKDCLYHIIFGRKTACP
jgi:hypothetical protein